MKINCDIDHDQWNYGHNEKPEDEACSYALELKPFSHRLLLVNLNPAIPYDSLQSMPAQSLSLPR
jgi:hypothetical protein